MRNLLFVFNLLVFTLVLEGQEWVDTTYTIQSESDIHYGTAAGFAGTGDSLFLDISYPTDDSTPECGRPLLLMIHGGAWLGGDKAAGNASRIRQDFAKRGYFTASISYRLGQFHTDQFVNCNVPGWNCLNMTDSSEWYRANYRAMQDAHGALRYLINRREVYEIDPDNVFLVGESAGGFIAMGVGFLDDPSEVLSDLVGAYPDAPPPNTLYEESCIQALGLAPSIADMDLSRPELGLYTGDNNLPLTQAYHIRAVGNFYGGAFNNIFQSYQSDPPALYLYHQPCDLIVPYRYNRVFTGYVNCFLGFPANCGYIVNRPFVYGSRAIAELIDTLVANNLPTSEYLLDNTTNNYNCLQQLDANFSCHAIDNYWARTSSMATFFADKIEACVVNDTEAAAVDTYARSISPNPASGRAYVTFKAAIPFVKLTVRNELGQVVYTQSYQNQTLIDLDIQHWSSGLYLLHFQTSDHQFVDKLVVRK
jgi:hypothetical protein